MTRTGRQRRTGIAVHQKVNGRVTEATPGSVLRSSRPGHRNGPNNAIAPRVSALPSALAKAWRYEFASLMSCLASWLAFLDSELESASGSSA